MVSVAASRRVACGQELGRLVQTAWGRDATIREKGNSVATSKCVVLHVAGRAPRSSCRSQGVAVLGVAQGARGAAVLESSIYLGVQVERLASLHEGCSCRVT